MTTPTIEESQKEASAFKVTGKDKFFQHLHEITATDSTA